MKENKDYAKFIGKRIEMIHMEDPYPIMPGALGTIVDYQVGMYHVKWDDGRELNVIVNVDKYRIIS